MTQDVTDISKTPGDTLRTARLARGLSIADIARSTRQSQDTLVALENMRTDSIPATILRMQARMYAVHLGLDGDAIANAYAEEPGQMRTGPLTAAAPRSGRNVLGVSPYIGVGILAFSLLAIAGFWFIGSETDESYDALAVSSRVQMGVDQSRLQINGLSVPTTLEFSLRANRRAWIEVRGSDGTIFRSRHMSSGETYFPRMRAGWTVTAPDAGAFGVFLDDAFVTRLGEDGQAVYSRNIDEIADTAEEVLQRALAERESGLPTNR